MRLDNWREVRPEQPKVIDMRRAVQVGPLGRADTYANNPLVPASFARGSSVTSPDYQGVLQTTPSGIAAVDGGRWTGSAWLDTLTDGTPLQPSAMISTPNGAVKSYIQHPLAQRSIAYTAGQKVHTTASDGVLRWYECTVGGTTAASAPVFPTSGTVVDGGVTWSYGGYHTIRGVLVEPGATNIVTYPNDALGAGWTTTGTGLTRTNVGTNGIFSRVAVGSGGATWHRAIAKNSINIPNGTVYTVRFFYEAGTSGKLHVEARDDINSLSAIFSGTYNAPSVTSQAAGTITNLRTVALANSIYMCEFLFTKITDSANCSFGIGPNSAVVGETIIVLGADIILGNDLGGSHIYGTPGATSTRAKADLDMPIPARETEITVVVRGAIGSLASEMTLFTGHIDSSNGWRFKRNTANTGWRIERRIAGAVTSVIDQVASYAPGEAFIMILRVASSGVTIFSKSGNASDATWTTLPAATVGRIGRDRIDLNYFIGPLNATFISRALSNADCQALVAGTKQISEVR